MAKASKRKASSPPSLRPTGELARRPARGPRAAAAAAAAVVLLLLLLAGWWWKRGSGPRNGPSIRTPTVSASLPADERTVFAAYAGSASCRECHAEAFEQWESSHHALAERLVRPDLDRGSFDPPRAFAHATQRTAVAWSDGSARVTSVGLSGREETHPAARVIGADPLRQFLVPFPGGRFQALEASYDPRSNEWFNVYGGEDRKPGEWGHWTGRGMNWNFMCAGCHNTRLRRNYDASADSYRTTMAERSVGCEACHGPLRAHVDWQKQSGRSGRKDPTVTRAARAQILDDCGACHARRTDLTGDFKPGDPFPDNFSLALVDEGDRYYADGQVRDEDYEYGSFLGSRMHLRGVTCLDCHNPHTGKTLLPGNWLCLRCHNGSRTDAPAINPVQHSFHRVYGYDARGALVNSDLLGYRPKEIAETGGECVNCHMPQTAYMQRHRRHDHGFTTPDPLLTKKFNIPNACNRCHKDRGADWAIEACEKWYGEKMNRPSRTRAEWIARARQGDPQAPANLRGLLEREESPYWRAVLEGLLDAWAAQPDITAVLVRGLEHTNAFVRAAAAHALEPALTSPGVAEALRARLDDPARSVRIAAAWVLRASLDPGLRAAAELRHFLDGDNDQPIGRMRSGDYWMARSDPQAALPHYQKAVAWDSQSPAFRQRLAGALGALNRPGEAVETLREACRLNPGDAESHYQLGLALNETGDLASAARELQAAAQLDPRHARAWYNLGLAQSALGQTDTAIASLLQGESADPQDERIPYARATILARLGRLQAAAAAARRALEINPAHAEARKILRQLGE